MKLYWAITCATDTLKCQQSTKRKINEGNKQLGVCAMSQSPSGFVDDNLIYISHQSGGYCHFM